ncbi:hypothetical protein [Micromonospora sp. IBHARD004]
MMTTVLAGAAARRCDAHDGDGLRDPIEVDAARRDGRRPVRT